MSGKRITHLSFKVYLFLAFWFVIVEPVKSFFFSGVVKKTRLYYILNEHLFYDSVESLKSSCVYKSSSKNPVPNWKR
jgi:hypothetical protein